MKQELSGQSTRTILYFSVCKVKSYYGVAIKAEIRSPMGASFKTTMSRMGHTIRTVRPLLFPRKKG